MERDWFRVEYKDYSRFADLIEEFQLIKDEVIKVDDSTLEKAEQQALTL